MKERIVIDEDFYVKHFQERELEFYDEQLCSGGNPEEWWHYKKEQVPENFEDVKQLTKELMEKLKLNKEIWEIKIEEEFIYVRRTWETKEICFTSVGNMVSNNGWDLLMTNLTPPRQWQIIKSLVGKK